jgi:hypothetical protein
VAVTAGGIQANANINPTHAATFDEFVHEVRHEQISHILFMASYAVPWKYRILELTLDVIRHYPDFPEGSHNWDDRVFHPDAEGVMRPISQLWPGTAVRLSLFDTLLAEFGYSVLSQYRVAFA